MLKNKMAKLVAIASTVTLMVTLVTGCAAKPKTTTTDTSNLAAKQVVRYNLGADPKTIDPALNDAVDGATVICNAFEGLMRLDAKDKPIPGVAESYKVSTDQMTYTFKLKKDAVWSDGVAVKASDFVYAWTRALDPATASPYAYQMYYVKGGEAFNSGKGSAADLGVKATDESTLVVTLENPTSYFISLMAFPTYAPVRKDIIEAHPKDWAINPATYVVNGPFMMKSWVAKDTLTFVKNPKYWNAKAIKLSEIDYRLLDDETAYTNAFKAGEIDFIEAPPQEETQQMLADGTAKLYPYLGTYYIEFNVVPEQAKLSADAQKVLKDPNIRKALSMAIDRTALIKNVTKANQLPALAFVPAGIPDPSTGKDFRAEKNYISPTADVAGAQKLLAAAGYPGGKGFPKLEYLFNTSAGHQNIAQALQDMWKTNLGIDVSLKNQEWAVFQTTRQDHNFAIARAGWIADYTDPMTFLDMFTTGNGNNDPGYSNPDYDKAIAAAKKEANAKTRMTEMHKAEDVLMADMPIIPLYFYTNVVCMKPTVKGVHKSPLGFVFFDETYMTKS